ncbi:MAG: cupredoxin domain-containing protein [Methermicoccaceae archaeon]
MRAKIVLAVLCMLTLCGAGCVSQINVSVNTTPNATESANITQPPSESNASVSPSPSPTENITQTPPPSQTPVDNYSVYLKGYTLTPRNLTLYVGGRISFVHYQTANYPTFVLVSDEGLWNDLPMRYGDIFTYTFNHTGVYHFHVKGYGDAMKGTVWVVERR